MTAPIRITAVRGLLDESTHLVHAVVVHHDRGLVMGWGDIGRPTWWRSAAKPFQALPLVQDGAADAFDLADSELALACASHSSEPRQVSLAAGMLAKGGIGAESLACGAHPPLGAAVQRELLREGQEPSPIMSNCSGKHAGMLLLARHHDWPIEGYHRLGHPVQRRIMDVIAEFTGLDDSQITLGVDGCAAVCFGVPLRNMALAWARLAASANPSVTRIRAAMLNYPEVVAGQGRSCTRIMKAYHGTVVAKIGAEGVYCAGIPDLGLGIALKVENGDMKIAAMALVAVLRQVERRGLVEWHPRVDAAALEGFEDLVIKNTVGEVTGFYRIDDDPVFVR